MPRFCSCSMDPTFQNTDLRVAVLGFRRLGICNVLSTSHERSTDEEKSLADSKLSAAGGLDDRDLVIYLSRERPNIAHSKHTSLDGRIQFS